MRRFEQKVTMMYKVLNDNAPAYLQEQFKKLKDSVPYNPRNADVNLALPKPSSEYMKKSFGYSGAVAWNSSLPRNLQNSLENSQRVQTESEFVSPPSRVLLVISKLTKCKLFL